MDDLPDFAGLRRRGVGHAQKASGNLWTDYNVHDPGVTLLEQTCFALTELVYRAEFDTRDLLTGEDGELDLARLGLRTADKALPVHPVTAADLAAVLSGGSEAEPAELYSEVLRVLVYPCEDAAGLYDLFVIPRDRQRVDTAVAQVRAAFYRQRALCEDIRSLKEAAPVDCTLKARVEVRRRDPPELAAALIYDCCERLMTDQAAAGPTEPITRCDVFDAPELYFRQGGHAQQGAGFVDLFFLALGRFEQIRSVQELSFARADNGGDPFETPLKTGQYRRLIVPGPEDHIDLELVSNDLPVRFDPAGMHKELARLRAKHIAEEQTGRDPQDWREPEHGRRRDFSHIRVGDGLPPAYGAGPYLQSAGMSEAEQAAALQLRGYLAFSDMPLANACGDLAELPELFAADAGSGHTYASGALDFGGVLGVSNHTSHDLREVADTVDPWRDRKGRQLDYLLALYGEKFSQNSLRAYDIYRDADGRRDAVLKSRVRFLKEIAELDRARNAGPDYAASQTSHAAGMGRKLMILLDFPDRGNSALGAEVNWAGLNVVSGLGRSSEDWLLREDLFQPEDEAEGQTDPFATLVPEREVEVPGSVGSLLTQAGFVQDGEIGQRVFQKAALPGSYALFEHVTGQWGLYLDTGSDADHLSHGPSLPLVPCGRFEDRDEAITQANRLRRCFADLNARSEGLYVIEDILLRGASADFAPLSLTVLMPGWTARTTDAAFRGLAEETVALVCPAHIRHRVVWLETLADTVKFEGLHVAWRTAYRDHAMTGAQDTEDALNGAAAALRQFIETRAMRS